MTIEPRGRLTRLLHHPRLFTWTLIAAAIISLPTIALGFYGDDWAMLAQLRHRVPDHGFWDLYHFANGDPAVTREMQHEGLFPWFTNPALKLHFFRPLTCSLIALDHALFGLSPLGYHLHQIGWYVALVAAVSALYRKLVPGPTAALAALIFAIDEAHTQSISWIACRHMVVAAVPSVLALVAYVRFREEGWRPGKWLSALALALALLGSEAAFCGVTYLLCYEAFGRLPGADGARPRWRERLEGILPVLVVCTAYAVVYKALHFGSAGNGGYNDPVAEPLAFWSAAFVRVPVLLGDFFAGVPSDLSALFPPAGFALFGLAATAAVALLYRAVRPRVTELERARLRFMLPGSFLGLIATTAGFPGARVLLLTSVGGGLLVALLIRHGFEAAREAPFASRALRRAGTAILFASHLVIAPILMVLMPLTSAGIARGIEQAAHTAELGDEPQQHAFVIGSDPMASFYPPMVLAVESKRLKAWSILSMSKNTHRITRTGPASIDVVVTPGRMFTGLFERVFRRDDTPFHVGEEVEVDDAVVRVTELRDGTPTRFEVRFPAPLEDPAQRLLAWQDGRLRRVALPAVGSVAEIPWSPGPAGLF